MKNITINQFTKSTGIKFTLKHTGKMAGMASLSTSVSCNVYCTLRSKNPELICSKCYAAAMLKRYTNLGKMLEKNTDILRLRVIPADEWPVLNILYFRFEAFGELSSANQVKNYFNLCYKNPNTNFALWTKNPWFIQEAINEGYKKPANLNIIASSAKINQMQDYSQYDFIDKIFTVYDEQTIKDKNIDVNCGSRSCMNCLNCYKKNDIRIINEKLK